MLGATLGLASPAFATAPSVQTGSFQSTSATDATLFGSVNPAGLETQYQFEYNEATSDFCSTGTGLVLQTPPVSAGSGTEFVGVQALLTGLTLDTEYCYRLTAINTDGTTVDGLPFPTFVAGAPTVEGTGAAPLSATSHQLTGQVNPSGRSGTTYRVDYAPASDSFCGGGDPPNPISTSSTALPFSDTAFHDVSVTIPGLVAGDDYCARLIAVNSNNPSREVSGQIFAFTAGDPLAFTNGTRSLTATGERLFGRVNPGGQSTSVQFKYAPLASDFCDPEGTAIAPTTVAASPTPVTGTSLVDVTGDISSGLVAGEQYCFAVIADPGGSRERTSAQGLFTAGDPFAATGSETDKTNVSVTLNGTVNPEGDTTNANFEMAPATSEWCQTNGASDVPSFIGSEEAPGSGTADVPITEPFSGLANNTQYCFRVIATNTRGTTRSAMASFTTALGPAPGQVQNLTATAGDGQVVLNWDDNPGGDNVLDYDVQRRTPPTATFSPLVTPVGSLFTDPGRTNGTQYCYQVRARNSNGFGLFSSEACATPVAPPVTPPSGGGTTTTPPAGGGTTTTPTTTTPAPLPNAGSGSNSGPGTQTILTAFSSFSSGILAKCAAGGPTCTVTASAKGTITVSRKKTLTLATKRVTLRAGKRTVIKLRLNATGRKALNKAKRLTLKITVTITAPGRKRIVKTRTIIVKLKPKP